MYIDGYFCSSFYDRIAATYDTGFATYDTLTEEKILVTRLKDMELCAIKVPVAEKSQQIANRVSAADRARWGSLAACVAISIILSEGWFAVFAFLPPPVISVLNAVLFWLPPVITVLVGEIVDRPFKRTFRDLCRTGISENTWVPVLSLDTRILDAHERDVSRCFSSLVLHIVLFFACLYFKKVLHMTYLRYIAQYIMTRIVFYNDRLLPQGIYYIAWQKWKKNHR